MGENRIGICIADEEYRERLTAFLMRRYAGKLTLMICRSMAAEDLRQSAARTAIWLVEGISLSDFYEKLGQKVRVIFLFEEERDIREEGLWVEEANARGKKEETEVSYMEKYQDANTIVDEIMKLIGNEVTICRNTGKLPEKTRRLGVYGLGAVDSQLPFAVTLASLLSEKHKVLLLDLQENSGLGQLSECKGENGLEELWVMTSSGRYSRSRLVSAIGHMGQLDFIYPAANSETICEIGEDTMETLLGLIERELDYEAVVINLGARFPGFFGTLKKCQAVFLLQGQIMTGSWREKEFFREMKERGMEDPEALFVRMEIPISSRPVSCERLIEQWKWNELGDGIRRYLAKEVMAG